MKKTLTYLLIILFSIQSFELVLIRLNFKLNQDFFAAICINKDKPEMHCNGQCHLKKQIQQHEEENSSKEKLVNEKEFQMFIQNITSDVLKPILSPVLKHSSGLKRLHTSQLCFDIFHPPRKRPHLI